jgi:hypothetical protein
MGFGRTALEENSRAPSGALAFASGPADLTGGRPQCNLNTCDPLVGDCSTLANNSCRVAQKPIWIVPRYVSIFALREPHMASASIRSSVVRRFVLGAAATATLVVPAAAQQYYYQPPPSYYHNDTREGTFTGAGLGAITGALVGGKKNWEGGALIGAGVGALTGRAIGSARDNADAQQVAVGSSVAAQATAQAAASAVTNYDLVQMSNAGLSDDLIISTIRSRGGRFDMSPGGLISLKQAGVSDRVVLAAQQTGGGSLATPINPPTTIHVAAPPAVYVRPAPVIHYYHGPRHHYGHHHHWHW